MDKNNITPEEIALKRAKKTEDQRKYRISARNRGLIAFVAWIPKGMRVPVKEFIAKTKLERNLTPML